MEQGDGNEPYRQWRTGQRANEISKAAWKNTAEVKRRYATAGIVTAERIVFNIKGNDYRLLVSVDFEKGIVWIKWIGTHRDYDKIDVTQVRHER
jgi:mRNA interferase HigB